LITRAGDPIPQRGTARYARDFKRVFITAVALYLSYTIYEAYHQIMLSENFYDLLTVPHDIEERPLRSRFRRLTVLYHPDKAGPQGEEFFMHLKRAYDVLSSPAKRYAYDRFGPEMLEWKNCITVYDFLVRGAQSLIPFYLGSLVVLLILSVLGRFEHGKYWRLFSFVALLIFETALITRPFPLVPRKIFSMLPLVRPLLAYEQAAFARKITLTLFIAYNQLGSIMANSKDTPITSDSPKLEAKLQRIYDLSVIIEAEAAKAQQLEFMPFDGDAAAKGDIERKMKDWLVEATIRNDPDIRDAVGNVLQRRRADAPHGAKGTKPSRKL
jgi:hypothetical protein